MDYLSEGERDRWIKETLPSDLTRTEKLAFEVLMRQAWNAGYERGVKWEKGSAERERYADHDL